MTLRRVRDGGMNITLCGRCYSLIAKRLGPEPNGDS